MNRFKPLCCGWEIRIYHLDVFYILGHRGAWLKWHIYCKQMQMHTRPGSALPRIATICVKNSFSQTPPVLNAVSLIYSHQGPQTNIKSRLSKLEPLLETCPTGTTVWVLQAVVGGGGLLMWPWPSILMCETLGWKTERASLLQLPREDASHDSEALRSLSPDIRPCRTNERQLQMRCRVFSSLLKCARIPGEQRRTTMPPQHAVSRVPARVHAHVFHACTNHSFPACDRFQDTVWFQRRVCGKGLPSNMESICFEAFFLSS